MTIEFYPPALEQLLGLHCEQIEAQKALNRADARRDLLDERVTRLEPEKAKNLVARVSLERTEATRKLEAATQALHKKLTPYWKHSALQDQAKIAQAFYPDSEFKRKRWMKKMDALFRQQVRTRRTISRNAPCPPVRGRKLLLPIPEEEPLDPTEEMRAPLAMLDPLQVQVTDLSRKNQRDDNIGCLTENPPKKSRSDPLLMVDMSQRN